MTGGTVNDSRENSIRTIRSLISTVGLSPGTRDEEELYEHLIYLAV